MKIAIVKALWHSDITNMLAHDAKETLNKNGIQIEEVQVPGAFEIPLVAKHLTEKTDVNAIIGIAVVLKGETSHNEHVATQASYGCQQVALDSGIPIIYGILSVEDIDLARARADGRHSRSGIEWALSAISTAKLCQSI